MEDLPDQAKPTASQALLTSVDNENGGTGIHMQKGPLPLGLL